MTLHFTFRWREFRHDIVPLLKGEAKNKVCSDREFVEQLLTETPTARSFLVAKGAELGFSPRTIDRYLARLAEANIIIGSEYGLYWRKS